MKVRQATVVRFILLVIGIIGAVTGLAFGLSMRKVNLIPIPGLTYANQFQEL